MNESGDSDTLDSILKRTQERTADRLDQRMQEASKIKAQEEWASQQRLEKMWLLEKERQHKIAAMQAEKQRQEQMLVRYVFIGAAVIVVVVIVLTIVLVQL